MSGGCDPAVTVGNYSWSDFRREEHDGGRFDRAKYLGFKPRTTEERVKAAVRAAKAVNETIGRYDSRTTERRVKAAVRAAKAVNKTTGRYGNPTPHTNDSLVSSTEATLSSVTESDETGSGTAAINQYLVTADQAVDEASDLRDRRNYEQSLAACERAREAATDALDIAEIENHSLLTDAESYLGEIEDLEASIEAECDAYQKAEMKLETIENYLDTTTDALAGDDHTDATEHLTAAEAAIDDTEGLLDNHEFDQLEQRLVTLRNRHDDQQRRLLEEALDEVAETIGDAHSALNSGDAEAALDQFKAATNTLNSLATRADEHGIEGVTDRIEDLHDQCQTGHERAEQALNTLPIPETIPSVDRHPLAYDDIEKGEPVGCGGNADVYHATAETDSETVELALKEPRMGGTLHTETIERMLDEAETWQQLDDHDHIVGVVDYGSEPLPWIAMEYMDGGHLGERAGEMEFEQAVWTAIATTKAVRHAHRRGVAHLDLKPENILFQSVEDAWDVPKVADWGLSKHLLEHSKSVGGMSPHYAAPEQFADKYGNADDITDVYQLGAVFYELFTGRPPFEGNTFEVINQIQSDDPTLPSKIAAVPPELDDILLTALATEKGDRYETEIYLRDDLQDLFESL